MIADATAAIALNAKFVKAYELRATAVRASGDGRKALQDSTIALGLQPDVDNYFQMAEAYQMLGEHGLAISKFDQAIALASNHPDLYFARAKSKAALGDKLWLPHKISLARPKKSQSCQNNPQILIEHARKSNNRPSAVSSTSSAPNVSK